MKGKCKGVSNIFTPKIRRKITQQKSAPVCSYPRQEGYVPLPGYTSQFTIEEQKRNLSLAKKNLKLLEERRKDIKENAGIISKNCENEIGTECEAETAEKAMCGISAHENGEKKSITPEHKEDVNESGK